MRVYLRVRKGQLSKENAEKGKLRKNSLLLMYHDSTANKREYEWLKLYVYDKPKTELQKTHNKETWQLAEAIKAQRVLDIQSRQHGFVSSVRGKVGLLTYFKSLVDKKFDMGAGNHGNWLSAYKHLKAYCKGVDIHIDKVDERFLEGFREYLLSNRDWIKSKQQKLHQNTALSYFNKVRTAMKEAFMNKMIKENPCLRVKCIKEKETHRQYLTFEELQLLANTECKDPLMKKAFLFSALTGLRFSDVKNCKWGNIKFENANGWTLYYTQKKTNHTEVLPIGDAAIKILGERRGNDDLVFEGLIYSAYKNRLIADWIEAAGIDKHIRFHNARHTHATLLLTMNVDLFTISKMLGHRHIKTTTIYAKVVDKKKIEAAAKMPMLDL